jgi:hypothetical protein
MPHSRWELNTNDGQGNTSSREKRMLSPSRRKRWRLLLAVLAIGPFMFMFVWECGHYIRFGHLFSYGYHTDLIEDHSDIGVSRLHTAYCLRVTNYTLLPLKFEGIQTPWGITDSQVIYHDRLERWSPQTHSWSTVFDHAEGHANVVTSVWPGRSIYPTGCYEVARVKGLQRGDTVRLVAFTLYSKSEGARGQYAFYSQAFTVPGESAKNSRESGTIPSGIRPTSCAGQQPERDPKLRFATETRVHRCSRGL